jgi:hypothetical protein
VPHPVGDRDESLIVKRGAAIAAECARVLTTRAEEIEREFAGKHYPLPRGVMPR